MQLSTEANELALKGWAKRRASRREGSAKYRPG